MNRKCPELTRRCRLVTLVSFIARQLGVNPAAFTRYRQRDQTRREQLAELMERLGYRSLERASYAKEQFDGADMLQETDVDIFAFRNAHFQNAGDFLSLPIDDTGQQ
jgi:hypothetical protein